MESGAPTLRIRARVVFSMKARLETIVSRVFYLNKQRKYLSATFVPSYPYVLTPQFSIASWFDHSRDLLQMINHFRAFMQQPMFGVGHSMGACQLVHLSLMHPRLFESLVLIDPVIQRYTFGKGKKTPAHASAFRKDRWISRTTAADYCSRSDFYQSWDPRVLKRWIEYGFRELPTELYPEGREDSVGNVSIGTSSSAGLESGGSGDGRMQVQEQPVTLTTSRHQEVFTFARPIFPPSSLFNPTSRSSSSSSPVTSPSLLPSSSVSRSLSTSVASVATSISTSSPLSSSISNPPDLDPAADDPHSIFYRPEPIQTFHQLSHLRPTVLYIFGARSEISTPSMRAEKMAVTGVGVGGSRGPVMTSKSTSENAPLISHASNGTGKPLSPNSDGTNPKRSEEIREIVISEGNAGHLVPFEQVTRVANEIAAWIGAPKTRRRWMENTEKEKREWFGLSKEERRQLADGFLDRLRKDGGTMVGMRSKL